MSPHVGNDALKGLKHNGPAASSTSARSRSYASRASRSPKQCVTFLESLGDVIIQHGHSLEQMLASLVNLLPSVCRSPESYCAQAIVRDRCFSTPNWSDSPWMAEAEIRSQGTSVGKLQLAHSAPRPNARKRSIPRDEYSILVFVAALMGKTVERLEAIAQLQKTVEYLRSEQTALEQTNAALQVILDRIEEERKTTYRTISANVDSLVMPVVQAIETQATSQQRPLLALLKSRLGEFASPFADKLSRAFANLTPLEISLCHMIRDNLSTKEIANIRHVSPSTVAHQREFIRRKLGIARTDTNLATYLRTKLPEAHPLGTNSNL